MKDSLLSIMFAFITYMFLENVLDYSEREFNFPFAIYEILAQCFSPLSFFLLVCYSLFVVESIELWVTVQL